MDLKSYMDNNIKSSYYQQNVLGREIANSITRDGMFGVIIGGDPAEYNDVDVMGFTTSTLGHMKPQYQPAYITGNNCGFNAALPIYTIDDDGNAMLTSENSVQSVYMIVTGGGNLWGDICEDLFTELLGKGFTIEGRADYPGEFIIHLRSGNNLLDISVSQGGNFLYISIAREE